MNLLRSISSRGIVGLTIETVGLNETCFTNLGVESWRINGGRSDGNDI